MIITRTPFRIPFGGGGTDLPGYYSHHGGFVFSAGIDKYMYVCLNQPIVDDLIRVKYSRSELVAHVQDIEHDLVRAALQYHGVENAVEIISMADVPAGTGLGSSSCYMVGLLNAIRQLKREYVSLPVLAEEACHIEMEILKKPVGKQDQYMAAMGGLTVMEIERDGKVAVRPARVSEGTLRDLNNNLLLFFTGIMRSSSDILASQDRAASQQDREVTENMHRIKDIGYQVLSSIESGNLSRFGELMHEHWNFKKKISKLISNPKIDEIYERARSAGAIGGKIMGAGGGGFFVFYSESDHRKLREEMARMGLREMQFHFDFEGSKTINNFLNHRRSWASEWV